MSVAKIERMRIDVPANFDPDRHAEQMLKQLDQKNGTGWRIESFDPDQKVLSVSRAQALTQVRDTGKATKTIRLGGQPRPSDGDKFAAKLADEYPGFYMTKFDPFLAQAELAKLSPDEVRCRGAVSVALGVKPWDVEAKSRRDGGYDLKLPKSYQPSRHDTKLEEVATSVVGMDGWYVLIDAKKLTASLIPSDPPTFPGVIPFPMQRLGKGDAMQTPFGHVLPGPGEDGGTEIVIDWVAAGSLLVSGLSGGGKSVTITAILADRVSNGAGLAVIDTSDKAVDFLRFKDLCAVKGVGGNLIPTWGCDTLGGSVAVLAMLCEEGQARAKVMAELGINNWLDMPKGRRFQPVFVVADEFEALVTKVPEPKALPKDHPIRVEAMEENMAHDLIAHYMNRLVKEYRFTGLHSLIATQVSNASTGLPPSLKGKMGHFVLCGSTPSEAARRQAFPDERSVPHVPENVANGGAVSRGTGAAKIEGGGAYVFKSYFAPIDQYQKALAGMGLSHYSSQQVTPTQTQVDRYLPSLEENEGDAFDEFQKSHGAKGSRDASLPDDDPRKGLSGHELANMNRHMAAGSQPTRRQKKDAAEEREWGKQSGGVASEQMEKCPSCDTWVHPVNGCRCQT